MKLFKRSFVLLLLIVSSLAKSQDTGEIHGNFQTDVQYYNPDTAINAPVVPEKVRTNTFANVLYKRKNFTAGMRFESYQNVLLGFDERYKGNGIPYRFVSFNIDELEVTAGNFYEQFGSGLLFRSFEERGLLYDNAMDGVRLRYNPMRGVYLKGIFGQQRFFFDKGPGIVRGADAEFNINEVLDTLANLPFQLVVGGSFISKYQKDQDPVFRLPENVAGGAGRVSVIWNKFQLFSEYAYKINDPSAVNDYKYKPGSGALVQAIYSTKGLGVSLSAKRIENMSFKSDRNALGAPLNINYLPALTKQHTYNLVTFYPYATQPNGEVGLQAEVVYTIKKGTVLGGEYGTTIIANYSSANGLDSVTTNTDYGYRSNFFGMDSVYFKDFNVEVSRKINSKLKVTVLYANQVYNKDLIQGLSGYGVAYPDIGVIDVTYKFSSKHALRTEVQGMFTKRDFGSWGSILSEFTISPHYFFSIIDQYNFGNEHEYKRIHYLVGNVGYVKKATRITIGYGRQREGIFCVGGICRLVPASNGLTLTVSSSF